MNSCSRLTDSACLNLGRFLRGSSKVISVVASVGFAIVASQASAESTDKDAAKSRHSREAKKAALHREGKISAQSAKSYPIKAPERPSEKDVLAALDKRYLLKGWNIPFPSFSDSITGDAGGWRSELAKAGFGFSAFTSAVFADNMLNTPTSVPRSYPTCTGPNYKLLNTICAGNQIYFGQKPSYQVQPQAFLTYDLSQWGVPDGQLTVAGVLNNTNDDGYAPNILSLYNLNWYQTLLDRKIEIKAGYVTQFYEFMGTNVGGNIATPFGTSASMPALLGLGVSNAPTLNVTFHITDQWYDKVAVQRSVEINGPVGIPSFDNMLDNPYGIQFLGPKGTRALFVDEIGYKQAATPGSPSTWLRFNAMFNNSDFKDLSKLTTDPKATTNAYGLFLLGDRQLWQQDPSSAASARRGIYAGFSAEYAPPNALGISQYYEGRAYWIGALAGRPDDMLSFIYGRNVPSHYAVDLTNSLAPIRAYYAASSTNSYTASLTAHLSKGLWSTVAVSYTDHPSVSYFPTEGPSFNFLASLLVNL
jgi:porin